MSLRRMCKIEREVLVSFNDNTTSIIPSKLIKGVRPGLKSEDLVEVTWEGSLLPCKILRLSDDHSDLLFLQRALQRPMPSIVALNGKTTQHTSTLEPVKQQQENLSSSNAKSQDASTTSTKRSKSPEASKTSTKKSKSRQTNGLALKKTAKNASTTSSKKSKSKDDSNTSTKGPKSKGPKSKGTKGPAPKKMAKGKKTATVIARFCEDEMNHPLPQILTVNDKATPRDSHAKLIQPSGLQPGPSISRDVTPKEDPASLVESKDSEWGPSINKEPTPMEDLANSEKSREYEPVRIPFFPEVSFMSMDTSRCPEDISFFPEVSFMSMDTSRCPEDVPKLADMSLLSDINSPTTKPDLFPCSPVLKQNTSTPLAGRRPPQAIPTMTDEMWKMVHQVNDIWGWMREWRTENTPHWPTFSPVAQTTLPASQSTLQVQVNTPAQTATTLAPPTKSPALLINTPAPTLRLDHASGATGNHVPTTPLNPSSLSAQPPTSFSPSTVSDLRNDSSSIPNYALSLVRKLFTDEEMKVGNCRGVKGKSRLDPKKMDIVRREVAKHPLVAPLRFESLWNKECRRAIDEGCRRLNRNTKSI